MALGSPSPSPSPFPPEAQPAALSHQRPRGPCPLPWQPRRSPRSVTTATAARRLVGADHVTARSHDGGAMAEEERALLGSDGGGGAAGPARRLSPCHPQRLAHRLLVLALMCFLGFGAGLGGWGGSPRAGPVRVGASPHEVSPFPWGLPPLLPAGSYFCYDNPAALQTQVQAVSPLGAVRAPGGAPWGAAVGVPGLVRGVRG